MLGITKAQWLKVDLRYTIFYNASSDVVAIRSHVRKDAIILMPGHVVQVNTDQGYLTRIDAEGVAKDYFLMEGGYGSERVVGQVEAALYEELDVVYVEEGN